MDIPEIAQFTEALDKQIETQSAPLQLPAA
jgi:hypothetical protein